MSSTPNGTTEPSDLNLIKIPLPDIRKAIVELMKEGKKEITLLDALYLLRQIYRESLET